MPKNPDFHQFSSDPNIEEAEGLIQSLQQNYPTYPKLPEILHWLENKHQGEAITRWYQSRGRSKKLTLWILLTIGIVLLVISTFVFQLLGPVIDSVIDYPRLDTIYCPSETTCYAVGDIILVTKDGGQTWQKQSFSGVRRVLNISCLSPDNCFAVSWSGSILSTTNGGKSWAYYSAGANLDLDTISCPGSGTCFIGGSDSDNRGVSKGGIILATNTGGKTWVKRWSSDDYISEISCPDPTTCFTAGYGNDILTTFDGGNTWDSQRISSGTTSDLKFISCPDVNTCYAASGLYGRIMATNNRGQAWQAQQYKAPIPVQSNKGNSSDSYRINHITCPSPTTCFVVGYERLGESTILYNGNGGILITSDGGKNWTAKSSNEIKNLDSISCPTISTCFALDSTRGYIVVTRDGGQTWTIKYQGIS